MATSSLLLTFLRKRLIILGASAIFASHVDVSALLTHLIHALLNFLLLSGPTLGEK
jgi:hypothetical protein